MITHGYLGYIVALITISSVAQTSRQPGQPGLTFRDCPDCPEMVVIPTGSFTMGSPVSELGQDSFSEIRLQLEGPLRASNIKQFAVGKFDITRGQWAAFVSATNRPTTGGCSWSFLPGAPGSQPWDPNPEASWKMSGILKMTIIP
ncbi:MAG: SUMF1/EgtB/PvdO family nonheme iron enzyme [Chryseolinea sp.]